MANDKSSLTAQGQLYSQSWTTVDDIRDRVSRHSDLMEQLISTMLSQEILLDRLVTIAEQQTQILAHIQHSLTEKSG